MKFKPKWQDVLLVVIIAIYLFYEITLLLSLKKVPSPLYGGDYWFSHGAIQAFMSGGNPFASSNIIGSEPGYLPLYTLKVGLTGIIFGLSAFNAMKVFSVILTVASLVLFYLFANYLFKNKGTALISTILYLPMTLFPIWKYRQFTGVLMMPLMFFAALYFYKKRNLLSAIIAGISLGLMGISHTAGLMIGIIIFGLIAIDILIVEHLKFRKEDISVKETFKQTLLKSLLYLVIIAAIGFVISLLYFYKPLFVHHMNMPESSLYAVDFSTLKLQTNYIFSTLRDYFLDFQNMFTTARCVLFALGVLTVFFLKKYDKEKRFLVLVLLTTFIGTFHEILTQPIIGTSFSPIIIGTLIFPLAAALFGALFIDVISDWLGKFKVPVIVIIIALLMVLNAHNMNVSVNDQWIKEGQTPLSDDTQSLQNWIMQNTKVNDVFISSNELDFSVNALTGRKVLNTRRAQNSPFLNMDDRQMAAAIILYGNDDNKRIELLKEYNVKYLYWNYYWLRSDFVFDNSGQLVTWFDPIIVRDTPIRTTEAASYNFSYTKQYAWLDPTVHEPLSKENLIIIGPYRFDPLHPWNPALDTHMKEVWSFTDVTSGQVLSRVYEVTV